ncbi:MAG TPA: hypothetical protein DDW36_01720 [Candidatus Magasanikbacteria bacterium]|nr:hypothetical protein [Candidatus Magasanikbacteria bacterium]
MSKSAAQRIVFFTGALLFFVMGGVPVQAAPTLKDDSTLYEDSYKATAPLLRGDCWTKEQCTKARGEIIPAEGQVCVSTWWPAPTPPATGPQEVGNCVIASIPGNKVRLNVPLGDDVKYVSDIGQYVKRLYVLAMGLGVLSAMIVIVHAGLMYAASAGNPEVLGGAKKHIGDAIIGLFLLLGSYTLLYTINPDLVNLRPPALRQMRTPQRIAEDLAESLKGSVGGSGGTICPSGWVARLNGFVKNTGDYKNRTDAQGKEASPLLTECGMVLPGPAVNTACISTWCSDPESICILRADKNGSIGANSENLGKPNFGLCATNAKYRTVLVAQPVLTKDPWRVQFDDYTVLGASRGDEGVCGYFKAGGLIQRGTIGTYCPNLPEGIGQNGGTTCYLTSDFDPGAVERPMDANDVTNRVYKGFVGRESEHKVFWVRKFRGVQQTFGNSSADIGTVRTSQVSCPVDSGY